MSSSSQYQRLGEQAWNKIGKINSDFFTLTYGAFVMQLIEDFENVQLVNEQLDKMGYNIGIRIIDEFLAKSGVGSCGDFQETAEVIAKVAFKMFLGITGELSNWSSDKRSVSIILNENPLTDFVDLPPQYKELKYSNILCGVIRGALEMVKMKVECQFVKDMLQGGDAYEIRVELKEIIADQMDDQYRES